MTSATAVGKLVAWLVEEGKKSVAKGETRPNRIRGCLEGFRIVAEDMAPHTPERYEAELAERRQIEQTMLEGHDDPEAYWEYHCATAQIEHVYKRLQVVFGAPVLSGHAVMQVHDYLARSRFEGKANA